MVTVLPIETDIAKRFLAYARQKGIDMSVLLSDMLANMIKLDSENGIRISNLKTKITEFSTLEEDWDGYGASVINRKAISNSVSIAERMSNIDLDNVDFMPSHNGAVIFKLKINNNVVSGEIGDASMSYFVRVSGKKTEYHNFEPINKDSVNVLIEKMEGIC